MSKDRIGITGLALSALGALISSVSLVQYQGSFVTSLQSGIQYHPAFISSVGFNIGLFLLILGFVLQIRERTMQKTDIIPYSEITIYILLTLLIFVMLNLVVQRFLFY
jgi:hypothetical protein